MKIERATRENLEAILTLQKLAFQSQAKIYGKNDLPPLIQTLEEIQKDFSKYVFLKAMLDEQIIGSVKANVEEGTCYIGRLIVHPDHQNQGIGKKLMLAIENYFEKVIRFELFTGHKSEKNIHLYESIGYKTFKTMDEGHEGHVKLLVMEKMKNL